MTALRTEIWCRSCQHHETLQRRTRPDETCPACGAGIYVRRGPPPSPATHFGVLLRALVTLRGAMFVAFVAVIASVPDMRARAVASLMVTLGALKLAMRAMRVTRDGIEFPELSLDELFDAKAVIPSIVFSAFFLFAPMGLLAYAAGSALIEEMGEEMSGARDGDERGDLGAALEGANGFLDGGDAAGDDDARWAAPPADPALAAALAAARPNAPPDAATDLDALDDASDGTSAASVARPRSSARGARWGAVLAAVFLLAYAPSALVLYLRTGTTWALFFFGQGVRAIRADLRGYATLCAFVLPAVVVQLAFDGLADVLPFFLDPIAIAPRTVAVLFAWGVCGLYVRSRARALDVPVDEDDWILPAAPAPRVPTAPPLRPPRPTSIALDGVPPEGSPPDGGPGGGDPFAGPSDDAPQVVVGTLERNEPPEP